MDDISRQRLDEIRHKEPAALSEGDIEVLRARSSYLSAADRERYATVLGATEKSDETSEPARPTKKKKDEQ